MAPQGEANTWPDGQFKVEPPTKTFTGGIGWSAGFIFSLIALQTVTLSYVEKTDVSERVVWLVIAFPCFLAVLGIFRLAKLLCKKQLFHHRLSCGVVLVDPAPSFWADLFLISALGFYSLLVLGCALHAGMQAVVVALVTQMGPAWTVLKALRTAREQEEQLRQLVLDAKRCHESFPKVTMISWSAFLSSARRGNFSSTMSAAGDANDEFNAMDLFWHRAALRGGLRGASGFAVLPGGAALLAMFLAAAAMHGARYACAAGALTELQLVTELHGIDFQNHQKNYVVHMDTSFTQVALQAACSPSSTSWISVEQPNSSATESSATKKEPVKHPVYESKGFVSEEIQLSQALIPRAALVKVQGLRPSLAPTQHRVRFSPLRTLPFLVNVTAGDYHASIPWSAVPGSTVSLPPDVGKIDINVTLVDFYLGLPVSMNRTRHDVSLWTVFNTSQHANDKECNSECEANLNCLTSFLGVGGCYFAFNNHSTTSMQRRVAGRLDGCAGCDTRNAMNRKLGFEQIEPDWQGTSMARLLMALELDVGGQHFVSEAGALELRRGRPVATGAVAKLIGTCKNGSTVVMSCNTTADKDVMVVLEPYDPFEFDALQLLVMPVVTDPAFAAQWSEAVMERSEAALLNFSETPSCQESRWLRERYAACGAAHALTDLPLSVTLSPWNGLEEPRSFKVMLREGSESAWPPAETYHLQVLFKDGDSPAAWAAASHSCELLKMQVDKEVGRSADALCALANCSGICDVMNKAVGTGEHKYFEYFDAANIEQVNEPNIPLLTPYRTIKALACHAGRANQCQRWHWVEEDSNLLRLHGTGTKMSPAALMLHASRLKTHELGRRFIQAFTIDEVSDELLANLARAAWEAAPGAGLLTVLAEWNEAMPTALLNGLVEVGGDLLTPVPQQLQGAFAKITELRVVLQHAEQLAHVVQALRLARNVTTLQLSCARCPESARTFGYWDVLCPELQRMDLIGMDAFRMAKGVECAGPMRATTLALIEDEVREFPQLKAFALLTDLILYDNPALSSLPEALFELPLKTLGVRDTGLPGPLRQRIREELEEKKKVYVNGV